jgi:hypothetical protein
MQEGKAMRKIPASVPLLVLACAFVFPSFAQSTDVFSQIGNDPVAPLTAEKKAGLQDPLFRLVLGPHPEVTKLSDVMDAIQPVKENRRIFVVDEHIKSPALGQTRRAVIDFSGTNGGFQLGSNVMLSVFLSSDKFPLETDIPGVGDIEAWGWDDQKGVFHFYKFDADGHTNPTNTTRFWKLRGSSDEPRTFCLTCHTSGVPVMKELLFPWNNWHSFTSPAAYLTSQPGAGQSWPVIKNGFFPPLFGGDTLETVIKASIVRFNNRRLQVFATPDGPDKLLVKNAKLMLRPLFDTTEINLASSTTPSGLHPIPPNPLPAGPTEAIKIPNGFFLAAEIFAGGTEVPGLNIVEAKGFSSIGLVKPDEYRRFVVDKRLAIGRGGNGEPLLGDANFAWLTPELGFAAMHWIGILVQEKVISREFAAAALAVDLETPIFSARRPGLLNLIPEGTFTVIKGQAHPDALTQAVIATLEARSPAPGSAEAEFLTILKAPSPLEVVRAKINVYKDEIAGRLNSPNASVRAGEVDRLFGLLIERRRAFMQDQKFSALIESPALIPMPAAP